jgi:uncharacterized protein (DUF2062 family)
MPRKLLKKYLPDPAHLREHKHLRVFGERLADPSLWHMNRRGIANAAAIGLFCALLPMPFQMLPAAMLAILFRANLPLSIALVWLTNPLTAVPVWYGTYLLGSALLGMEPAWAMQDNSFEAVWDAMWANFGQIYIPMLVGSLLVAIVLGIAGWAGAHQIWRAHIRHQWRQRAARRAAQSGK